MTRPPLSVIVPTRDRPAMLRRCLESLAASIGPSDEVIVVDSASRDAAQIASIVTGAGFRLVRCDEPGVNRARNAGWRAARYELLAYVDDDVVVERGWADAFGQAGAIHATAAFVTGRTTALEAGSHADVATKGDACAAALDRTTPGDLGHGNNLLVRAAALEVIGGWDEAMGVGARFKSAPENDLYDRLFAAALSGRHEPAAVVRHDQWRRSRELIALDWRYGYGNGARIAKLARSDRARARRIAAEAAWGWGVRRLFDALRYRHKTDAARVSARLAGTAIGFVRGLSARVVDGHYVEWRASTSS